MPIIVLKQEIAEKIAAGEVIESPAAVVKELVENSIDAGATRVEIKIKSGGLEEITVTDNGTGIPFHELRTAFERHATSKITSLDDLNGVRTMGFRGEALPSVGTVARVTVTSRAAGCLSGGRLQVTGGRAGETEETGAPPGTAISVRDLFFNTPARKEFMKTPAGEMRRITDIVITLALSQPFISFSLLNGEKQVFRTAGNGHIPDIMVSIYGNDVRGGMLELSPARQGISGIISAPHLTRSTRRYQHFFVNNRIIRSTMISHALKRGYKGLILPQKFPLAVINIHINPEEVDVNVHPAKWEVRFKDENKIYSLVTSSVEQSLITNIPGGSQELYGQQPAGQNDEGTTLNTLKHPLEQRYELYKNRAEPNPAVPHPPAASVGGSRNPGPENHSGYRDYPEIISMKNNINAQDNNKLFPADQGRYLGQLWSSFLIVQREDYLLLVDQHAAHERIIYEDLAAAYRNSKNSNNMTIMLAVPLKTEIPASWREGFETAAARLQEMGFSVESLGQNSYVVREIPAVLQNIFSESFFTEILEELMEGQEIPDAETMEGLLLKNAACREAFKVNNYLADAEAEALLERLKNCSIPDYCPHGRPAVIKMPRSEIEKGFKRG